MLLGHGLLWRQKMQLIELCQYTLRQSLCDSGDYSQFYTAEDLINNLNKEGGIKNGRTTK